VGEQVIELERVITTHANKPANEPIAADTFCSCDAPRPTYHLAEGTAIRARRPGAAHSPAATCQGTNMAWRVRRVVTRAMQIQHNSSLSSCACLRKRAAIRCACGFTCASTVQLVTPDESRRTVQEHSRVCLCVCVCVCVCVCMSARTYLPCHSQPESQGSVLRSLFSPATRPKCGRAHRPDAKSRVSQSSTTAASMVAPDKCTGASMVAPDKCTGARCTWRLLSCR
jgi:hypothetical protein